MNFPSYIAGRPVYSDDKLEVYYPWDNSLTGTVSKITRLQLDEAIEAVGAVTFVHVVLVNGDILRQHFEPPQFPTAAVR